MQIMIKLTYTKMIIIMKVNNTNNLFNFNLRIKINILKITKIIIILINNLIAKEKL